MAKNLIIFSRSGVHHTDKSRGDAVALYVPTRDQIRTFNDIGTINTKSVKERYGGLGQPPLWRQKGSSVTVFGLLPDELQERRNNLEVYLAQDVVPDGSSVFYYVVSDARIVHGVRTIRDDGTAEWGVSRISTRETGALDVLISAVSERVASGAKENICVAVHDDKLFKKVTEALKPFSQEVVRFNELSPPKATQPIYVHRDHGLIYIVLAMVSGLLLIGAAYYAAASYFTLRELRDDISSLQRQIEQNKSQQTLGSVGNPNAMLDAMEKPLQQRPSSIIYAAAEAAADLGELKILTLETGRMRTENEIINQEDGSKERRNIKVLPVNAEVGGAGRYMLLDQERLAKSTVLERPWIRYIERTGRQEDEDMKLELGVRAD